MVPAKSALPLTQVSGLVPKLVVGRIAHRAIRDARVEAVLARVVAGETVTAEALGGHGVG